MLSNWTESNKKFFNLKLVSEVWPTTEMPKLVLLWDDFKPTDTTFNKVEWVLKKIKWSFSPAKWRMWDIYWFKAFLEDWEEVYVIDSTITNASKWLLNALLTSIWKEVKVSLYLNKNWYPSTSVRLWDWNFAQTAFDFQNLDWKKLYDKILELDTSDNDDIRIEDIPF